MLPKVHLLRYLLSCLASGEGIEVLGVCVCVCVCVRLSDAEPQLLARRISLRGEGHALYPVLRLSVPLVYAYTIDYYYQPDKKAEKIAYSSFPNCVVIPFTAYILSFPRRPHLMTKCFIANVFTYCPQSGLTHRNIGKMFEIKKTK